MIVRVAPGLSFDCPDDQDHIQKIIRRTRGFYEKDLLTDAGSRMGPGIVVDVGAHIGNHTTYFAGVLKRKVVALEPNPQARELLERNIRLNRLDVEVLPVAAGRTNGFGTLGTVDPANTGMTQVSVGQGDVQVVPLDALELQDVALVKIDVEGSELDVLQGAEKLLTEQGPVLYVEAGTEPRRRKVAAYLKKLGYEQRGQYAKTPTYCFSKPPRISLSVAIMAHPSRAVLVSDLLAKVDGPVVWDEAGHPWDTGRRAMLAHGNGTHHLVLQDDAVVCRDLIPGLEKALAAVPMDVPISLYTGRKRPNGPLVARMVKEAERRKAPWLVLKKLLWGVGIVLPVPVIEAAVKRGDDQRIFSYDSRLQRFFLERQSDVWYSVPSLVEHRDVPSLFPNRTGTGRTAHSFLGEHRSALEVDWTRTAFVGGKGRY